jgi:hypothetical protein
MRKLFLFLAFFLSTDFVSIAQNCSVNAGISSVICQKIQILLQIGGKSVYPMFTLKRKKSHK